MQRAPNIAALMICGWLLAGAPLEAAEVGLRLSPVWWNYQESSAAVAGFASTPLNSSASGYALDSSLSLQGEWMRGWRTSISIESLLPLATANETWNLNGSSQRNRLDIYQLEPRIDHRFRVGRLETGAWLSYLWQRQSRSGFVVNNTPVVVPGEPVVELVQSAWAGLSLVMPLTPLIRASAEVGVPFWVRTTNSLVAGEFTRNRGLRAGAGMEWSLHRMGGGVHLSGEAHYRYREMGNDLNATSLWPKNRWQELSVGVKLTW